MLVEVHFIQSNGTFKHMANVRVGGEIQNILEYVFRVTQNIEGSWSVGQTYDDGTANPDFNIGIEVLEPLHEENGRKYGHRSSMMGDRFYVAGRGYEVGFIGFKQIEG